MKSRVVPQIYLIGTIAELPVSLVKSFSKTAARSAVAFAVQLRDKERTDRELYEHARKLSPLVPLYVNGRPHVAAAAGAEGVQLGPRTLPVKAVRKAFPGLMIGYSAHNGKELKEATGADFAVLSPFSKPLSKPGDGRKPLGISGFQKLAEKSPVPVLALGGIVPENIHEALHAWAAGIAASGGILRSTSPAGAFESYLERFGPDGKEG